MGCKSCDDSKCSHKYRHYDQGYYKTNTCSCSHDTCAYLRHDKNRKHAHDRDYGGHETRSSKRPTWNVIPYPRSLKLCK